METSGPHSALTHLLPMAIALLILLTPLPSVGNTNSLTNHPSPYLAMHGSDPVHWQTWTNRVVKQAQSEQKLIFISSGYFSCHWCHVMHEESYQHAATATLLNQHFINVKLDRELNPTLDQQLVNFSQRVTGVGGWPQHVVLTPEGQPFAAFVYLPNQDFQQMLKNISRIWQSNPGKIRQLAGQPQPIQNHPARTINAEQFQQTLLQQLAEQMDEFSGGMRGSHKFPRLPLLKTLLEIETLDHNIQSWLTLTLNQIQSQHLHDHIHGGFYRYTVDPEWQTPHFEKMAYTSAQLAEIYLLAGQRFQRSDYTETAKTTLHYLDTHLYNPVTQLYQSSQSAIGATGQEGEPYLWSREALQKQLSAEEFAWITQLWQLEQAPPYELGWHPKPPANLTRDQMQRWQSIKAKLAKVHQEIPVDHKSLLAWNGLILSSYSLAAKLLKEAHYQHRADQLSQTLQQWLLAPSTPKALSQNGQPISQATLEEYALIYQGLQDWQTHRQQTLKTESVAKLERAMTEQWHPQQGWFTPDALPNQRYAWHQIGQVLPSVTAIAACLKPNALKMDNRVLLQNPLAYPNYLHTLQHCQPEH